MRTARRTERTPAQAGRMSSQVRARKRNRKTHRFFLGSSILLEYVAELA